MECLASVVLEWEREPVDRYLGHVEGCYVEMGRNFE